MLAWVSGSFRFMVKASQIIAMNISAPIIEIIEPIDATEFHIV